MKMDGLDNDLELELETIVDESEEIRSIDSDYFADDDIFNYQQADDSSEIRDTLVDQLLQSKGIKDSKIKIIDENNAEQEVNFYDLSKEEQLEILNSPLTSDEEEDLDLGEKEAEFFNYLKENNLSVEEYLQKYKEAAIAEVASKYEPTYDIDAYGDEELFLLDLKAKYDFTDEELEKELTKALEDQGLFNKKVTKLRQEYKELEDAYNTEQEQKFAQDREENYNKFVDTMVNVAVKNPELYGIIELDDAEKNEVLSYILELDDSGTSAFYKELNTPEKLYEAAWFLKYGKEALETLTDAYEQEIKKLKGDNSTTTRVVKKEEKEKVKSIYEL